MKEAHVLNIFERLEQGSRARAANLDTFRRVKMDLANKELVVVPQETRGLHIPRAVLPVVVALGLLAPACAPAATKEQPQPSVTEPGQPPSAETPQVVFTPTPEPTPTPAPTPVEAAIKEGKIEIKEPEEWEKYFTVVSPEEAREMLAKAKEREEFKFLFPQFDLSRIKKDFLVENRSLSSSTATAVHLVARGIEQGAHFYSNLDGEASASSPSSGLNRFISVGIYIGELRQSILVPAGADYKKLPVGQPDWPLTSVYNVKDGKTPIAIGRPLFILPTEDFIEQGISDAAGGGTWRDRLGDWQMSFFISKRDVQGNYDYTLARMDNILTHPQSGKIVMIGSGK